MNKHARTAEFILVILFLLAIVIGFTHKTHKNVDARLSDANGNAIRHKHYIHQSKLPL